MINFSFMSNIRDSRYKQLYEESISLMCFFFNYTYTPYMNFLQLHSLRTNSYKTILTAYIILAHEFTFSYARNRSVSNLHFIEITRKINIF